jgi:hypothetical protein
VKIVTRDLPNNAVSDTSVASASNPDRSFDPSDRLSHFANDHGGGFHGTQVPVNLTITNNVIVNDDNDPLANVGIAGGVG